LNKLTYLLQIKEGDITLHYIAILAMCCRVISPSFLFL